MKTERSCSIACPMAATMSRRPSSIARLIFDHSMVQRATGKATLGVTTTRRSERQLLSISLRSSRSPFGEHAAIQS